MIAGRENKTASSIGIHLLLLIILSILYSKLSIANEQTQTFHIRPQSLSGALNDYAEAANVQLIYQTSQTAGLRSDGIEGSYTQQQALGRLLAVTNLIARQTENGTVTLDKNGFMTVADNVPTPTTGSEQTLPKVTVEADAEETDPYDSNDISNPANKSYSAANATAATKINTPIMETPYSTKVITQQVFKDQQIIRLDDAIRNVAGVQSSFTNGGDSDIFIIRGFPTLNFYRDGFLVPSGLGGGNLKRQVANLDRIEVLKGPGSALYGRNEPGGIVNIVTKRPLATPYYSLQQQFGSYDFYRTTADATGPITEDDTLLYRVNLSYENAGSFRDFVKTDTVFFAPSLTWNISDRTQANLDIEYQHFDNTNDSGIPPIGNRPAPVPINRQTGEPLNSMTRGDRTYVGAHWSHEFNDDWKLTHRFGAEFFDAQSLFTFYFGEATPNGDLINIKGNFENLDGNRGFNNGITHQQNYYTTLNLNGKFKTGILKHNTLWGFDYFVIDNQDSGACCGAFPEEQAFNIFNPVYQTSLPANNFVPTFDVTQNWYGLYWQDQIKFPFNIYGNVGVRYDNAKGINNFNGLTTTDDDKVSPRGGLLWQPVKWLALYGNYSENFGVSNSLFNALGQRALPPTTAEQWELGAKTQFFDGRLNATFAYFELTRKNSSVADTRNPSQSRAVGEQESRGYEFELTGEVLPGWNVIGAYTHLAFANITRDIQPTFDDNFNIIGTNPGDTGNRMYNAPRHYCSLWSTYEFLSGNLQGLKFGGGLYVASQSQGTNANTFQLPGYVTLNLMTSYGMKIGKSKVTAQLNVNNILDKTYFVGNNSSAMINFGQPLTFMGSVKVEF